MLFIFVILHRIVVGIDVARAILRQTMPMGVMKQEPERYLGLEHLLVRNLI